MLCGWATATPAGSSNARRRRDACAPLPDELLVEVYSKLPKQKADLLGDSVSLETRGAVERVCRRWRRLALQRLPASLDIDFCELHEMGLDYVDAEEALEELLPHIEARSIDQCCLQGCTAAVAPALPAKLARAVFPQVRK